MSDLSAEEALRRVHGPPLIDGIVRFVAYACESLGVSPLVVARALERNCRQQDDPHDLALAKVDASRRWPSTVEASRSVPPWEDVQADEEAQAALAEVGLASDDAWIRRALGTGESRESSIEDLRQRLADDLRTEVPTDAPASERETLDGHGRRPRAGRNAGILGDKG